MLSLHGRKIPLAVGIFSGGLVLGWDVNQRYTYRYDATIRTGRSSANSTQLQIHIGALLTIRVLSRRILVFQVSRNRLD